MTLKGVELISGIIVLLLLFSVFLPVYTQPYEQGTPSYRIAHESTEGFEDVVEEADLSKEEAVPVEDLSPSTQQAFDEARANPENGWKGWQTADVTVCANYLVVCNAYSERPDFPEHGVAPDDSHPPDYGVIEHDGEIYVSFTSNPGTVDLSFFSTAFIKIIGLLPFTALMLRQSFKYIDSKPQRVRTYVWYGLFLLIVGVTWPYISMFTGASLDPALSIPLGWGGIVVALGKNRVSK